MLCPSFFFSIFKGTEKFKRKEGRKRKGRGKKGKKRKGKKERKGKKGKGKGKGRKREKRREQPFTLLVYCLGKRRFRRLLIMESPNLLLI